MTTGNWDVAPGGCHESCTDRLPGRVDEAIRISQRGQARCFIWGADCSALMEDRMSVQRLGRRGVADLREQLSQRDFDVLGSVERFRLLGARHIERLHFADHATRLTGARVARRVLERLTRDRVLARLERRIGGVRAGSASFVYAVGSIGHRLLHDDTTKRWREPSRTFVVHTLAVAELAIQLIETDRAGDIELLSLETEPSCWRRFTGQGGASETLKPDLGVVTADTAHEYRWFVEIDLGTESSTAIARKCRTCTIYWRGGLEQERHDVFPRVLWVADTDRRAALIERAITTARQIHRSLFAVTTADRAIDVLRGEVS